MTDTPTPTTPEKRAELVAFQRGNGCRMTADQLEADGVTIATLTAERDSFRAVLEGAQYGDIDGIARNPVDQSRALGEAVMCLTIQRTAERDAARAEIARLTAALATAREDGMREVAMCFDAIAHATPAQSPKHMAANYRDRFLDKIAKGAAT